MNIDGLAYNVAHRHTRIQAGVRILENDLHLSSVGKHINLCLFPVYRFSILSDHRIPAFIPEGKISAVENRGAIVDNAAAGRLIEAQKGTSCGRLSAAGLAYQTQCFSLINIEGYIINSLNHFFLKELSAGHREILFQILDFKQLLIFHQLLPPCAFSNSAFWSNQQAL